MALNLPPRVSVVVPAYNAAASLNACLAGLAAESVPGADAELIVVDDGSTDATAAIASAAGARVLSDVRRGPAAARNRGAHASRGELLVFLDADTVPEPGWLAALLQPLDEDAGIVAAKGRYVSRQRGLVPRFSQLEFEEKYARLARARRVDFVDTGTAVYRRSVFLAANGFDESFPPQSAEDVELAFRLAEQGARFAFCPEARVQHAHASSLAAFLRKKLRYGYFRATIYQRYPRKLAGDAYTPPWMALQIVCTALLTLAAPLPVARRARWPLFLAGGAFLATCWPLLRRSAATDRALLPWVAPFSYLRALAQGLGLAAGLGHQVARRATAGKTLSAPTHTDGPSPARMGRQDEPPGQLWFP